MVDRVLPTIGSSGFYELRAPFASDILANERYTCQAIRRFSDYLANNEDLKALIYTPKAIPDSEYDADLEANEYIISLQADVGQWIYVPSRYLVKFPDVNGIPYRTMAVAVGLPPLPVEIDYAFLTQAMENLIRDTLGVTPSVEMVETSMVVQVGSERHETTKAERDLVINGNVTDRSRYMKALQTIDSLITQKTALEEYIKQHHVP